MNQEALEQARRYFTSLETALDGLDTFFREDNSPGTRQNMISVIASAYLKRLRNSLKSWENKVVFEPKFRVSQSESGFPAFENVLDLANDRKNSEDSLAELKDADTIRKQMVDFILTKKKFPTALQTEMARRSYLETINEGEHFSPLVLPKTIRVSVNRETGRPYYIVHWGFYDGVSGLPLIYILRVEDSSPNIVKLLVGEDGRLNEDVDIDLPVGGLLNPNMAVTFDDFCEKNSAYSLMLSTIASSLDRDFEHLHPKRLQRLILGPFYHAAFTRHGEKVDQILARVRQPENAWLMTWTTQEIFSIKEHEGKSGFWSSSPSYEEFYVDTDNLEASRQRVSEFERHALVPHEAYQAIYASQMAGEIFNGYSRHVISEGHVLRNM